MATRKKATAVAKPQTFTLTKEQFQTLREIARDLMNIREELSDLEGNNDLSTIMFKVGSTYNVANKAETSIDELIDQLDGEDCDECDDDF